MFRAITYLLFGAAIGGAVGILFAPRPGEETREQLQDWLNARREEGAQAVSELRQRIPAEGKRLREAFTGTAALKSNRRKRAAVKA